MSERIEALDLVAAAIDANKKKYGTPEHKAAVAFHKQLVEMWKAQHAPASEALQAYVDALSEFEIAHKAWMNLKVDSDEGRAAKQYKNSCAARFLEARRVWERTLRK